MKRVFAILIVTVASQAQGSMTCTFIIDALCAAPFVQPVESIEECYQLGRTLARQWLRSGGMGLVRTMDQGEIIDECRVRTEPEVSTFTPRSELPYTPSKNGKSPKLRVLFDCDRPTS